MHDDCPEHSPAYEFIDEDSRETFKTLEEINADIAHFESVVSRVLAGEVLKDRSGVASFCLADINTEGMSESEINFQARIIAAYIVG
jgi:ribosomal protein S6